MATKPTAQPAPRSEPAARQRTKSGRQRAAKTDAIAPPGALLLTGPEMAGELRCSLRHLENLVRAGIVNPVRLGRMVRFHRETVLRQLIG
ncbi:MAG TPA: helix-turn-helix domain-containing protein [Verrucomicrobiales bacterium]|nr:helix-turn-helix domain-containing protein [Verrucomicrobiales bacterium]